MPRAVATAYSQPLQAALRSKAGTVGRLSRSWRMAAVDGNGHVGRGRGHDDRVDVAGVEARVADGLQRRLEGHAGRPLVVVGPAPLANAGDLVDVLIGQFGKASTNSALVTTRDGR